MPAAIVFAFVAAFAQAPPDPGRCVSPEEIAQAKRAENPEAFSDSAIPLGPLFWASRDRTFLQVMLVYWRYIGIEDRTRLEVTFPFWLSSCTPLADTTVGPLALFGNKTDAKGTAGYFGPYFFRRDDDAESDVLFPFYWHLLDHKGSTLILGPIFDIESGDLADFGLAPLYWGERDRDWYSDVTPVFARWGSHDETHLWTLQTWANRTPTSWDVASWPVFFAGESTSGDHHVVIPPLLTAQWGDGEHENTLVAQSWLFDDGVAGWDAGSFPFYAGGRHGDRYYDLSPVFARWGARDKGNVWAAQTFASWDENGWGVASVPFYFGEASRSGRYHHLIPPLLTFLWGDDVKHDVIAGPYWDFESPHQFDQGMFPFFARGADDISNYFLTPLFGAWGDKSESHVWVLQTIADVTKNSWDVRSYPFYFGGEDGQGGYHHDVPLALTAIWGDQTHQNIVAGPWFDLAAGASHDAGLFPLYAEGVVDGERPPIAQLVEGVARSFGGTSHMFGDRFHYRVVPPLFYAHAGNDDVENTVFLQSWLFRDEDAWDAGSFPLYAGGRHGDDYYDLTPVFARWGDARRHQLIAGPWFDIDSPGGEDYGLFPLFFAGAAKDGYHYRVIPGLYEHWGDDDVERTLLLTSWLFRDTNAARWDAGVFPLWAGGGGAGGSFYDVTPAFALWGDAITTNLWALQTFASWSERAWDVESFPFYFGGAESGGSYGHAVPLALTFVWGDSVRHDVIAGPFWHFDDARSLDEGLFPIYARGHDDDGSYFAVPALLTLGWGDKRGDGGLIAGPWFDLHGDDGNARGVFPLYASGEVDNLHWRTAPPLLYAHLGNDVSGDEVTLFAQSWLFREGDAGWDAGSFPFYAGGRHKDGYYDLTPLGGRWGNDHSTNLWALQTFARFDASSWNVTSLPFYFGGDDGNAWHEVAPPFVFAWGDRARDDYTTWVLPPAYMHWHTPRDDATLLLTYYARNSSDGTSAHALAPVWFAGSDGDNWWNVVAPAYFSWGARDESRWFFLPTLTYASKVHDEDWLLAPLVWHEKTRERDDTIVFPLWWSFNDDTGKALVVSGLWWDLQWPHEHKSLQLAPGYLRWQDDDEAFTIAGPVSWSVGRGEHKDAWSFHVFPLFSMWSYHPGHIRWRALVAGFGYEEEQLKDRTRREVMVLGMKFDPG